MIVLWAGLPLAHAGPAGLLQEATPDSLPQGAYVPASDTPSRPNAWGLDVLISNDGFGMGLFYRRAFSPDLFGFASLSISESKEEREVERYDPFTGMTYVPGKLNRFFVIPLSVGIQQRVFREDILDTFRPYVTLGAGPTIVYAAPFTRILRDVSGPRYETVEFFRSIGQGRAYYTASAFIGAGAHFGSEEGSLFGLNLRYYFTYLLDGGLESAFDERTGEVVGRKTAFGGFFITFTVGVAY
ncbi:MAG: hypothetical protein WB626_13145 [Bacteroidota bacterium]